MIAAVLLMLQLSAPYTYADLPTEQSPVLAICYRSSL